MADVQQSLESLRSIIARIIANLEVWDTLYGVLDALGLQYQDTGGASKYKYLLNVTSAANEKAIVSAAGQMIEAYPGNRGKPSDADKQNIQDALWWIESNGGQQVSNVTRYKLAETLEGIRFWGRVSIPEIFFSVLPAIAGEHTLPEAGKDGVLYEGISWMAMANLFSDQKAKPMSPKRISVSKFLREIGIAEWPDKRLFLFIELIVHPEVQPLDAQKRLVARINTILESDNFELKQEGVESGIPVYKVRQKRVGVLGTPKYIIFASTGPKPDIVINDALNMDIQVVRFADKCLIYDQPPPQEDLTWETLLEWWATKKGTDAVQKDIRQELGQRLRASLQSEPERIFFDTYFKLVKPKYGINLPALLPQVYLHYDPRNRSERGKPVLVRQRMDFLLLLRNAVRIVIEIDGIQHYADENGKASPSRYAEMVAEDRRIRNLGYEIFRFGGAEFSTVEEVTQKIIEFFDDLFSQHNIRPEFS